MNYNNCLFGAPKEGNFSLDETRIDDIPQVPVEKIAYLLHLILRMKYEKHFSKWSTIKCLVLMAFQLSSISLSGKLLSLICQLYSVFYKLEN
jgi:hypothetical protein